VGLDKIVVMVVVTMVVMVMLMVVVLLLLLLMMLIMIMSVIMAEMARALEMKNQRCVKGHHPRLSARAKRRG
jgi:cell division protein FtsI/penicillin-binding protein 2